MAYGFIGLGQMGGHMARNLLLKTTGRLVVLEQNAQTLAAFVAGNDAQRVHVAKTPREVAQMSEKVITMLPSPAAVRSVWTDGDSSLIAGVRSLSDGKKRVFIDCSTVDPQTSRGACSALAELGVVAADAPVSGGTGGAQAGTLTFMVGCKSSADYELVKAALAPMGANWFHCGDCGTGQVAKLCNNLMLGSAMIATSESLHLGKKLGIDVKVLSQIMSVSTGQSWSLSKYNPHPHVMDGVPSSRGYTGGFGIRLMEKDLRLAVECAEQVQVPLLMGANSRQIYKMTAQQPGMSDKDFSAVYAWMDNTIDILDDNKST